MNFKELLEKYKAGTATEIERKFVEADIEKNELINEYLSEQLMDTLPEKNYSLSVNEVNETFKLKHKINRRFQNTVIITIAIIIVLFCSIQYILFPLINNSFYNPLKGHSYRPGASEWGQMSIDMSVFSELHLKGYEIPFISVESEGFGKYDLTFHRYNIFRNYSDTQFHSQVVRNDLNKAMLGDMISAGLSFNWIQSLYGDYTNVDKLDIIDNTSRKELNRLPDSAQIKAYLFFNEVLDMNELIEFINSNSIHVFWAGIKCSDNDSMWDGRFGFSPLGKYIPLTTEAYDETVYPLLELDLSQPSGGIDTIDNSSLSAKAFETHFISLLQYMSGKDDFMNILGYKYDYNAALAYVKSNGVQCYGIAISGNLDEIKAVAALPISRHIIVDDVMISAYEE